MATPPIKNPLVFPSGRLSGINYGHPAFVGNRMVGLPTLSGAGYVDLRSGGKFTSSGAPANAVVDSMLGPALTLASASSQFVLRAYPLAIDNGVTIAGFVRPATVSAIATILNYGTGGQDWFLRISATGALTMGVVGVGSITSGVILAAGVPYFVAASMNQSASSFVAVNLRTGQLQTATGAGETMASLPTGNLQVGAATASNYWNGLIGPTMYSVTYLSLSQLKAWAADPWSFWYPGTTAAAIFSSLRGTTGVVQTFSGNLVPSTALVAAISADRTYAGGLVPSTALAADVSAIKSVSGVLAPATSLAANLTEVDAEAGALSPVVSLAGSMSLTRGFVGALAPATGLVASPSWTLGLAGGLSPAVALAADLTDVPAGLVQDFVGDLAVSPVFAAGLASPPLWGPSEVCPPSMWTPTGPCDSIAQSAYGMGAYGVDVYSAPHGALWGPVTPPPVTWVPMELCDG